MFQRCYLLRTADESWECGTDLLKSGYSGYGGWFAAGAVERSRSLCSRCLSKTSPSITTSKGYLSEGSSVDIWTSEVFWPSSLRKGQSTPSSSKTCHQTLIGKKSKIRPFSPSANQLAQWSVCHLPSGGRQRCHQVATPLAAQSKDPNPDLDACGLHHHARRLAAWLAGYRVRCQCRRLQPRYMLYVPWYPQSTARAAGRE